MKANGYPSLTKPSYDLYLPVKELHFLQHCLLYIALRTVSILTGLQDRALSSTKINHPLYLPNPGKFTYLTLPNQGWLNVLLQKYLHASDCY